MNLPRFPQPFLELLSNISTWRDILSLLSVDKREEPMRRFWINFHSMVLAQAPRLGELTLFCHTYPQCIVYDKIISARQHMRKETSQLVFKAAIPKILDFSQLPNLTNISFDWNVDINANFNNIIWPLAITKLFIGVYNLSIVPKLPNSVVELCLPHTRTQHLIKWPNSLKILHLDGIHEQTKLPKTLTHLHVGFVSMYRKQPDWPISLTHLQIDRFGPFNLDFLPDHLEYLHIRFFMQLELDDVSWPHGLKHLILGRKEDIPDLHYLPETLLRLDIGPQFDVGLFFSYAEPHIPPEYVPLVGAASGKAEHVVKRRRL